ncbi:MAG: hypothetical protein ACREEM_37775 [Blastocatellia bacterium]
MSQYAKRIIAFILITTALALPGTAQTKARRDRPAKEPGAASPPPVALVERPAADYLSGEANVAVRGNQNPVIRLGLSPNGVTIIEFPVADRFFALHPGNSDLVTIDESPTKATDHFLVVRAGSGFASPATMANARRAPVTSIIAQMQTGLVITFLFYPVPQLAEQAHRVVVGYDRDEVIAARRAAGLAINLDGAEEEKARTTSLRFSSPAAAPPAEAPPTRSQPARAPATNVPATKVADTTPIDTSEPPLKADRKSGDPVCAALTDATASPKKFKRWSDSVHGLSLSVSPVQEVDKRSQLVVIAVRNTKNNDAHILPGQPEVSLETFDDKGKPLQIEIVKKLGVQTTATNDVIPGGATAYYAVAYESRPLGARQRLRVAVGQTIAADEPATAGIASANR